MRLVLDNMDGVLKHLDASEIEEAHGRRDALLRDLGDRIAHAFGGSKPHSVTLSPGCELCGQGSWSCLFLHGVCNASCFFCPGDMVHRDAPPNAERISFYSTGDYLAYVDGIRRYVTEHDPATELNWLPVYKKIVDLTVRTKESPALLEEWKGVPLPPDYPATADTWQERLRFRVSILLGRFPGVVRMGIRFVRAVETALARA